MINIPSFTILVQGNDVEKIMLLPPSQTYLGLHFDFLGFLEILEQCAVVCVQI